MKLRDRIKDFRRVKASEILPNPQNWRTHPQAQQDALRGVLAEVGIADALLVRDTPSGLMLIDGHLRADVSPDTEWPCLVLDVDDSEAAKLLGTLDPLAAMAETDPVKLDALLREIDTGSEALQQMLAGLAEKAGIIPTDDKETEIRSLDVRPPPKMAWVLLGIPVVRFAEIAADVERLAGLVTICETTQNDGKTNGQSQSESQARPEAVFPAQVPC